jgi:hypothetical protein
VRESAQCGRTLAEHLKRRAGCRTLKQQSFDWADQWTTILEPVVTSLWPSSILIRLYRLCRGSIVITSTTRRTSKAVLVHASNCLHQSRSTYPAVRMAVYRLHQVVHANNESRRRNGQADGLAQTKADVQMDGGTDEQIFVLCIVAKARFPRSTWEAYLRRSL